MFLNGWQEEAEYLPNARHSKVIHLCRCNHGNSETAVGGNTIRFVSHFQLSTLPAAPGLRCHKSQVIRNTVHGNASLSFLKSPTDDFISEDQCVWL